MKYKKYDYWLASAGSIGDIFESFERFPQERVKYNQLQVILHDLEMRLIHTRKYHLFTCLDIGIALLNENNHQYSLDNNIVFCKFTQINNRFTKKKVEELFYPYIKTILDYHREKKTRTYKYYKIRTYDYWEYSILFQLSDHFFTVEEFNLI